MRGLRPTLKRSTTSLARKNAVRLIPDALSRQNWSLSTEKVLNAAIMLNNAVITPQPIVKFEEQVYYTSHFETKK